MRQAAAADRSLWGRDSAKHLPKQNIIETSSLIVCALYYIILITVKSALSTFVTRLQQNPWYAASMVLLAFIGAGLLLYEFTTYAKPEVVAVTIRLDLIIACIFMVDFFMGLFFNTTYTKKEYWRKNWLDFISSIPVTADMARALRILRALRALRVISSALDVYFTRRKYLSIKNQK